ncbi:MAG: hypothetical protein P8127_05345, partial [Acidobacteriota bacterium]
MADETIRRVGVVLKTTSAEAAELGMKLIDELERLGIEALVDSESAAALNRSDGVDRAALPGQVDLVVVLG